MNPNPLLLLPLILILIEIPVCFSQPDHVCRRTFQCGILDGLGYPFWGGDRPMSCGQPDFKVTCLNNLPWLNISSLSYFILAIDYSTRTLRVARTDLWPYPCPKYILDTSLDSDLFSFYSPANDQRITLYYGCTNDNGTFGFGTPQFNQFYCTADGTTTWNYFLSPFSKASDGPPGAVCSSNISVMVNFTVARALASFSTLSISLLQSGLRSGFWIQWTAEVGDCDGCERSGGACGINPVSDTFACHCRDRIHNFTCFDDQINKNGTEPTGDCHGCMRSGGVCGTNPVSGRFSCHCSDHRYNFTCIDDRIIINQTEPVKGVSKRNQKIAITGVSLGSLGVLLFGLIIFCIMKRYKLRKLDKLQSHNVQQFLQSTASLSPKRYSYNEIKRITKGFSDKLGKGAYGTVYKGWLPDGHVAVKVLTKTDDDGEEFINEVASISRTSHVNIVNLMGFCCNKKTRALVYEFMPNKSLDKFIYTSGKSNPESQLDWNKLYDIAVGVARGLEYLHRGCNTRIVHFDIKPHNILLDIDFRPKISDFGLAKLFKEQSAMTSMLGTRGTIGYIAPEVFSRTFGVVSIKSDVYSYGMMLLEMAGARKFHEIEADEFSNKYIVDIVYNHAVINSSKLDNAVIREDEEIERKMLLVGLWCIQMAPSHRPSMTKVVEMLEGRLESIQIPPKPFLSSPNSSSQVSYVLSTDFDDDVVSEDRYMS